MASDRARTSGITGIIAGDSLGAADGSRRLSRSVVTLGGAGGSRQPAPLSQE
jgi:hypothetical protein